MRLPFAPPLTAPLTALAAVLAVTPAQGAELDLTVTVPRLDVAEYHRPYVAVWIERPDGSAAANLAVWYDVDQRNGEGTKWLKDLRQWWRRTGRSLQMPVDGVTTVTKPPGEHSLRFAGDAAPLDRLPAGDYRLMIEAAREVGGREILEIPFAWPPKAAQSLDAKGEHELGPVTAKFTP